jgi:hypothetical protein
VVHIKTVLMLVATQPKIKTVLMLKFSRVGPGKPISLLRWNHSHLSARCGTISVGVCL